MNLAASMFTAEDASSTQSSDIPTALDNQLFLAAPPEPPLYESGFTSSDTQDTHLDMSFSESWSEFSRSVYQFNSAHAAFNQVILDSLPYPS
jgi:hypothetical protein